MSDPERLSGPRRRDAGRLPPWLPGIAHLPGWEAGPVTSLTGESTGESPTCSAKGCRADAVWVLAWNNPKLHTPDRRKAWATCEQHREHLAQFLELRGFLRETVPLADWTPSDQGVGG